MNKYLSLIVEGTVAAIVVAWVLSHSTEFGTVLSAVSQTATGSVRVLQGR